MNDPQTLDLANYSFEDFVSFLFEHDLPKSEKDDPWYYGIDVVFDVRKLGAHYVRLFKQPEFLITRFTKAQLEQGFWAIQSCNLDCSAEHIVQDSYVPLPVKEECIRSMADLFQRLFATEPLDTSVEMWWDSFC